MPRQARIIPPEGFLHITARGNNRRKLFFCRRDFNIYYLLLKKLKIEDGIRIFHYCLMSNHIHLLLGIGKKSALSRFMKRLNLMYFFHYRKKHSYIGHLWQDRFKSKLIEEDAYLIQCGKYIELNPVRGGIVKAPQDYLYSSYNHYALGIRDGLVDDDPLYLDISNSASVRQSVYARMVLDEIDIERKLFKDTQWDSSQQLAI